MVFAGATVCIALLGMLVLRLNFLNGVAIAASVTVVLTVAASVTLLPALLSSSACARSAAGSGAGSPRGREPEKPTGFAARWSAFVERHPKLLGAVATGGHGWCWPCPRSRSTWAPPTRATTRRPSTTRQAYDLLADGFGPGINGPLTVVAQVDGAGDRLALDKLRHHAPRDRGRRLGRPR